MKSAFFAPRPSSKKTSTSSSASSFDGELQLAIARSLQEQESRSSAGDTYTEKPTTVTTAQHVVSSKRPRVDGGTGAKEVEVVDLLTPTDDEQSGVGVVAEAAGCSTLEHEDADRAGWQKQGDEDGGGAEQQRRADVAEGVVVVDLGDGNGDSDYDDDEIQEVEGEVVEEEDGEPEEEPAQAAANPFAAFMFGGGGRSSMPSSISLPAPLQVKGKPSSASAASASAPTANKSKVKSTKDTCSEVEDFSAMSSSERSRVLSKWHSLPSPSAPSISSRRFQLLVAARLHARTQEPVVRKAMLSLHAYFEALEAASPPGAPFAPAFDARTVATLSGEDLALVFPSIHFANSKAEQIVQAAKEVRDRFGGEVPETYAALKSITGVGHKFATLLEFVNTKSKHILFLEEKEAAKTLPEQKEGEERGKGQERLPPHRDDEGAGGN